MAGERERVPSRVLKLAVIGTAAGAFSGLFGVGGGTLIVPLLILWFAYGERLATGTSLMAIIVIAALATIAHAFYGNVELEEGLLLSVPAVLGVVLGTAAQQRMPQRVISGIFAVLLLALAVGLVIP
jgi:uncharacterized membrane protein YfcA